MIVSTRTNRVIQGVACVLFLSFSLPVVLFAETVGVFFDTTVGQSKFAAGDVKTALESKSFTVEMLNLSQLAGYANKKVVIALSSNTAVTTVLTGQGGAVPTGLGEQAYALRTTTQPQMSYWALGGDVNGAMYGGLQVAENIQFNQFAGTYNSQESPTILKRGIKLNTPLDKISGTYGKTGTQGTSEQLAIKDVWDMSFWTAWFDEMARNRYNTISLWSLHPFSSMVSVPGYEDCAIQNVTLYDGTVIPMTIAQKIVFWKQVMAYAHSRGFEFILFTWNTYAYGAIGKHGIGNDTSAATNTYMNLSMKTLLETYPDLDGIGVTNGEGISSLGFIKTAYTDPIDAFAKLSPTRKFRFICREYLAAIPSIISTFGYLRNNPNVTLDCSLKWSQGHMYSSATPSWETGQIPSIKSNSLVSWLTVRNDDMYYLNWGDPEFARGYINWANSQLGANLRGFYMGGDGYTPTRTFFSKNSVTQGILEVLRTQYMYKLWGLLSYNPNTPDNEFINYLAFKYPGVSSNNLFNAWSNGSRGIQLANELVNGTYSLDYNWWPEACYSQSGFRTISDFAGCSVDNGSSLCSIGSSGSNGCGTKKTSYQIADSIQNGSNTALSLISGMSAGANTELGITLNNIRALSYIGLYYAEKIRGATYKKAANTTAARDAMGRAYCNWMSYVNIMDAMYTGMTMQRVNDLANWHALDANALAEYTGLGGTGTPSCLTTGVEAVPIQKKREIEIGSLSSKAISFTLPGNNAYSLMIFNCIGGKVAEINSIQGRKGLNKVTLGAKLQSGVYFVRLKSVDKLYVKRTQVENP